jgi:hypothetical protein
MSNNEILVCLTVAMWIIVARLAYEIINQNRK